MSVSIGLNGSGTGYFAGFPAYSSNGTGVSYIDSFSPGQTGYFSAELLSMDLTGSAGTLIRESPTLQSTGIALVSGSGPYQISSFFDIFTEISLNGGTTWLPSIQATRFTAETYVEPGVPEPGTGLLVGGAGLLLLFARRRRH